MTVEFRRSFLRDLRAMRDAQTLPRIRESVEQIEQATSLSDILNLTKLQGVGDFRLA